MEEEGPHVVLLLKLLRRFQFNLNTQSKANIINQTNTINTHSTLIYLSARNGQVTVGTPLRPTWVDSACVNAMMSKLTECLPEKLRPAEYLRSTASFNATGHAVYLEDDMFGVTTTSNLNCAQPSTYLLYSVATSYIHH